MRETASRTDRIEQNEKANLHNDNRREWTHDVKIENLHQHVLVNLEDHTLSQHS